MLLVGLTGGIGSGKSTVSAMLAERGAVVIDADAIAREVVEPGQPAYDRIVERFGPAVVTDDGTLDRAAIAAVVFNDRDALKDLEAITHPAVGVRMSELMAAEADTDHVVILDVPLLVEKATYATAGTIVVDVDPEVAIRRLVEQRGMPEDDARRRMAAQVSREERLAKADFVVANDGSLEDLRAEVDRCWRWLSTLARTHPATTA
ncbi:MAG TPA: dephospho-CoA kinase [Acidimicrobiales bacterium]|nr:dephospho-CoA kinase [Acidimicrobiales bacterium]